jgi:hypothetical protein
LNWFEEQITLRSSSREGGHKFAALFWLTPDRTKCSLAVVRPYESFSGPGFSPVVVGLDTNKSMRLISVEECHVLEIHFLETQIAESRLAEI